MLPRRYRVRSITASAVADPRPFPEIAVNRLLARRSKNVALEAITSAVGYVGSL